MYHKILLSALAGFTTAGLGYFLFNKNETNSKSNNPNVCISSIKSGGNTIIESSGDNCTIEFVDNNGNKKSYHGKHSIVICNNKVTIDGEECKQ